MKFEPRPILLQLHFDRVQQHELLKKKPDPELAKLHGELKDPDAEKKRDAMGESLEADRVTLSDDARRALRAQVVVKALREDHEVEPVKDGRGIENALVRDVKQALPRGVKSVKSSSGKEGKDKRVEQVAQAKAS